MNTALVRIRYLKKKKKLKNSTYQKLLNGSVLVTTIIFTFKKLVGTVMSRDCYELENNKGK